MPSNPRPLRDSRPLRGFEVEVSTESFAPRWDRFVAATAGGHHTQTSLWGQLKAGVGLRVLRIVVQQDGEIVAGAQFLCRSIARFAKVAYASKGPVVASEDPGLRKTLIEEICALARTHGIQCIAVQPPHVGVSVASDLVEHGFEESRLAIEPLATSLIDLAKDVDGLMSSLARKTRYNVRLGMRKGIKVREGSYEDLATYHHMLAATSERQGFTIFPLSYFEEMWRLLTPHGYLRLFVAEDGGTPVSAQIAVPFSDTVINKLSVWSGQSGASRPNEVLLWSVVEWAKERGYRWYDLEGIHPTVARAHLEGRPVEPDLKQSTSTFKLGFGGEVVLMPPVYLYVPNPIFRLGYRWVVAPLSQSALLERWLHRLRTGPGSSTSSST